MINLSVKIKSKDENNKQWADEKTKTKTNNKRNKKLIFNIPIKCTFPKTLIDFFLANKKCSLSREVLA